MWPQTDPWKIFCHHFGQNQLLLILCLHLQTLYTYIGLNVVSSTEFEVILFLNQMGVFNFVDDGSLPGCAVLKLSDGRKRSMSLWVEFITASGYLSARKIRSRFQTLVSASLIFNQMMNYYVETIFVQSSISFITRWILLSFRVNTIGEELIMVFHCFERIKSWRYSVRIQPVCN